MFKLTSKITVESNRIGNNKRFVIPNFVKNIQINSSWETLTDTCTFELPKKVNWEGVERLVNDGVSDEPALFERGDKITVELGYDSDDYRMFEGFISDIDPDSPVKITCQDMMWYLGQIELGPTYEKLISVIPKNIRTINTQLAPLLAIVNGIFKLRGFKSNFSFKLLDENGLPATGGFIRTGTFRYPDKGKNSVAGLLETLKERHDIYFYFRNNVLEVDIGGRLTADKNVIQRVGVNLADGLSTITLNDRKVVWPFHFQRNVINQSLTYVNEKRVPLKIQVSGSPSNTQKDTALNRALGQVSNAVSGVVSEIKEAIPEEFLAIARVGFSNLSPEEAEGAETLQRVNLANLTQGELLLLATRIYNNRRYTGFKGSFTTFGQYPTKHGDIALMTDARHPERNGAYLIKSVNTTFGTGGYRQEISLERNVSSSILN